MAALRPRKSPQRNCRVLMRKPPRRPSPPKRVPWRNRPPKRQPIRLTANHRAVVVVAVVVAAAGAGVVAVKPPQPKAQRLLRHPATERKPLQRPTMAAKMRLPRRPSRRPPQRPGQPLNVKLDRRVSLSPPRRILDAGRGDHAFRQAPLRWAAAAAKSRPGRRPGRANRPERFVSPRQ